MNEKQFKRLSIVLAFPLLILGFFILSNIKSLENVVFYCDIEKESCRFFITSNEVVSKIFSNTIESFENNIVIEELDYNQIIFNSDIDDPYKKQEIEEMLQSGIWHCDFSRNSRFQCKVSEHMVYGTYSFQDNDYKDKFFKVLENEVLSTIGKYEKTTKLIIAIIAVLPLILFLILSMVVKFIINGYLLKNIDIKYYLIGVSIIFLLTLLVVNFTVGFKDWS